MRPDPSHRPFRFVSLCALPLAIALPSLAQTWTALTSNSTAPLASVYFPTPTTGYAVGNPNVLKTTNAGATWTSTDVGWTYLDVFFLNADTGWIVGNGGDIRKTVNGGTNWTNQTNTTVSGDHLNGVRFANANVGYIAALGNQGRVLKTTNGGTNWTALQTGVTNAVHAVRLFGADTVFAATEGGIRRSYNGGTTWESANSNSVNAIEFPSRSIGYAAGGLARILKTTNGGESWTVQFGGVTSPANAITFRGLSCVSVTTCYAAGSTTGGAWHIYRTQDGGTTWESNATGTGAGFSGKVGLHFPDATAGYFVAQGGQIQKSGAVPAAIAEARHAAASPLRLVRGAESFVLTAPLAEAGTYDVKVTNLQGAVVWKTSGRGAAGQLSLSIPAPGRGVHVVDFRAGDARHVARVMTE